MAARLERAQRLRGAATRWVAPALPPLGAAGPWLLLLPALCLLVLLFLVPAAWLVRMSLFESGAEGGTGSRFYVAETLTLRHYAQVLTDRYFHAVARSTLLVSGLTAVVCLALAYPLALWLERSGKRTAAVGTWLVALPKLTNALVLLYGVLVLLGNAGLVNRALLALGAIQAPLPMFANLFAVLVGEALLVLPYPVLLLLGVFRAAETRQLEQAARGLGAGHVRAFFETTFRLTLPGAALSGLVTLVWGAGAFVAPLVLGNPSLYTVSVEIHSQTFELINWPLAAALSVTHLVVVGALALVALVLGGRNGFGLASGESRRGRGSTPVGSERRSDLAVGQGLVPCRTAARQGTSPCPTGNSPHPTPLIQGASALWDPVSGIAGRVVADGYAWLLLAFLVGPLAFSVLVSLNAAQTIGLPAGLGEVSLRWYATLLGDPLWLAGMGHSMVTASIAVGIAVPLGTLAAVGADHLPARHQRAMTLVLITPLFAPGVVLGLQTLALYQRLGLWGTPYGLGLAHAMWTLPLAYLAVRAALSSLDRKLEEAAQGLGAHPAVAFCLVTLPRLWPAMAAAAFLCAIMSLNELPMALFLSTPASRTLPALIWPQLRFNLTPIVAAASGLLLLLTVGGLLVSALLARMLRRRA